LQRTFRADKSALNFARSIRKRHDRIERNFDRNARARQQRSGNQTAVRSSRLGTWHFRNKSDALKRARTKDQFAEPAEHQDEINAFFFTTYLLEYVDYLHIGGDNGTFGSAEFPGRLPEQNHSASGDRSYSRTFISRLTPQPANPPADRPGFSAKSFRSGQRFRA
jgi:hypothetical protein